MADRTTITEVVTGLGMLDLDDVDHGLATRPRELAGVGDAQWDVITTSWAEGRHRDVYTASFMNGRAFLEANDALRGRVPLMIEWKGPHRAPGDEVVPADLRVDHVYLVSCKYLSRIVVNASPRHLFERLLAGGHGRRSTGDWFEEVAPDEHAALYAAVRAADPFLPAAPRDLDVDARRALSRALRAGWPDSAIERYQALARRVAEESACRWRAALGRDREVMLWRLLRIGSASYFVLGASRAGFVRLRIATPWDWRREFMLRSFDIEARAGGQSVVAWHATVRRRVDGADLAVEGHVEIRWSHGRFAAPPEAKVYLDTPHTAVPGYFALR